MQYWRRKRVMICGRTRLVRMQSRSRIWNLIRPWGCESALRKWHMRRGVGGCDAGAGRVWWALWTASDGVSKLCKCCSFGRSIRS